MSEQDRDADRERKRGWPDEEKEEDAEAEKEEEEESDSSKGASTTNRSCKPELCFRVASHALLCSSSFSDSICAVCFSLSFALCSALDNRPTEHSITPISVFS